VRVCTPAFLEVLQDVAKGKPMMKPGWLGVLLLVALPAAPVSAAGFRKEPNDDLDRLNRRLQGRVVDHTHNHGKDNRIWSPALKQWRDLYVYLPPHFDPHQRYPLLLWMHGIFEDEESFLSEAAPLFDHAMGEGTLPPMIVAATDGTLDGEISMVHPGSFFINSKAGAFGDYVVHDVWNFVVTHYPIRPERQAHILAGGSMGGFAAFNLGIKYRDRFGVVVGIFPPVNTRWVDCKGNYRGKFSPQCWGWRTKLDNGNEVLAVYSGLIVVRVRNVLNPIYGLGPAALKRISDENPIEMIDRLHLRPGELEMYIGYGGKDEFNIDAQVESFLYLARERGLCIGVGCEANGRHNYATAVRLFPGVVQWLAPRVAPYAPPLCGPVRG
jgi:hypothetical protein